MTNKKIFLAPLMGAMISVLIFSIYLISKIPYKDNSLFDIAYSYISVLPIITIVFIIISYIVCTIVGIPLLYFKNKFFLSTNIFWLLSFIIFSSLGLLASTISYTYEANLAKSFALMLSLTFGGIFSTSLFSVLNGDIKTKPL